MILWWIANHSTPKGVVIQGKWEGGRVCPC
jgi:hypothetical protein